MMISLRLFSVLKCLDAWMLGLVRVTVLLKESQMSKMMMMMMKFYLVQNLVKTIRLDSGADSFTTMMVHT
jgi:hypothetical protein